MKTKQAIISQSERFVRANGLSSLSVAKIAQSLGISEHGFAAHFSSRAELLSDVVDNYVSTTIADIKHISKTRSVACDRLIEFLGMVERTAGDEGVICLLASMCAERLSLDPAVFERAEEFYDFHLQWLTETFELGWHDSSLVLVDSPHKEALFVLTAIDGGQVIAKASGDVGYVRNICALVRERYLSGKAQQESSKPS